MERTLIRGAAVLSMDPAAGDLARGDILVEGSRIRAIGPNLRAAGAGELDASGMLALPGLINAHFHTWETALRGIGGDWTGREYFRVVHAGIATRYTPEDTYLGNFFGALSQLDAGVTTLFDWCHGNPTPAHTDAAVDALFGSGIRAVFGHGTVKPDPRPGQPHYSQVPHPAEEARRLRAGRLSSDAGRVTLALAILGADYSTLEVTLHDMRLARELGLLSSAHIWGRDRQVPRGYHALEAHGLLGPGHNITHGNYLEEEELKLILDAGVSVTSTPAAELQTHAAEPLMGRVRRLGGRPSIGTDHEAYAGGSDMFFAMRFALQTQRLFDNLRRARGELAGEGAVPVREALAWATLNNARAIGLGDRVGSLAPGKEADILLLRRDALPLLPGVEPAQAVVLHASPACVDTVFVGGCKVKAGGKLLHAAEGLARMKERLVESRRRLLAGAGG